MRSRIWLLGIVLAAGGCAGDDGTPSTSAIPATPAAEPPGMTEAAATTGTVPPATTVDPRRDDRERMVAEQLEPRGVADPGVLRAMRSVPRHRFVPETYAAEAYADHPLPIGDGQTISQPFIVGLMTQVLDVAAGDRVLEIGTGSGYQAAVLAEMGLDVYTVEIIPELAARAARTLDELGYEVATRTGDGYFGWEEHAPYDAIVVTAAPDHVPQPLLDQLAPGGRMVIPIGPIGAVQTLWRFTVDESGETFAENLGPVRFVPLTREEG